MRILTVVGARPQFIKAAAVSPVLRKHHEEILVHTGQHYDDAMSQVFFDELGIPAPDVNLEIGGGHHGAMTARMLDGIEKLLLEHQPDCVLVYGDTNSTLAGALAAAKLNIPIAHVEAGLRSHDRSMPEEINRILTDHAASILFAPTQDAVDQLAREGITGNVHNVGDVMVAAQQAALARANANIADELGLPSQFWLVTLHRPANVDDADQLRAILNSMAAQDAQFVWPVHPRAKAKLADVPPNVHLLEPQSYVSMQSLLLASSGLLTDSGGMQKEAVMAGRLCATMRTTTEWVESIESGWNVLVSPTAESVRAAMSRPVPQADRMLWGDAQAAQRIAALL